MRDKHYTEGKICFRCGDVAKKAPQHDCWGLTPDPSDLWSPRGIMRQLCRGCLESVITAAMGNEQVHLIATFYRHGADSAVMIGEGFGTEFKAFVPEHTFSGPCDKTFELQQWNGERVLVKVKDGGDMLAATLICPIIP